MTMMMITTIIITAVTIVGLPMREVV